MKWFQCVNIAALLSPDVDSCCEWVLVPTGGLVHLGLMQVLI